MFTGTVFNLSDVHIGHPNSIATIPALMSPAAARADHFGTAARNAFWKTVAHNIAQADVIVFNGDIIDTGYEQRNEPYAMRYRDFVVRTFARWSKDYPDKSFYCVMGNHEGLHPPTRQAFAHIAATCPNVFCSDYGVVVGNTLFTHGDLQLDAQPDLKNRTGLHRTNNRPLGTGSELKLQRQYEFLREYICSARYEKAKNFMVLRHQEHGAPPVASPLLPKEVRGLDALNMMFGHTHDASNVQLWHHNLGNSGGFKHDRKIAERQIFAPQDLHAPMLTFVNGRQQHPKHQAFPNADGSWAGMVKAAQSRKKRGTLPLETPLQQDWQHPISPQDGSAWEGMVDAQENRETRGTSR